MMTARLHRRHDMHGFTLIELMITVAIIAIMAAIALPSYQFAMVKSRRAQGRTAIFEVMLQQERFMTQNNVYAVFDGTSKIFKTFSGDNNTSNTYDITAVACSATDPVSECIKVVATPKPAGADPACGVLSMTSNGLKQSGSNELSVCWP